MNFIDQSNWKDKLSNFRQIGGIETSILDNGSGRGTRIAWVNTGTGLRFKIVLDRGMDILDAFHNEHSLSWISNAGHVSPEPFSNQGIDWLRTLSGGLLTTCGISFMGPPNEDETGSRGLHGFYSNTPAELVSIKQPDIYSGSLDFEIVGVIRETTTFGPSLELKRTISGKVGSAEINIRDEIFNRGNSPAPNMVLYHINCGWPLINDGTRIVWKGDIQPRDDEHSKSDFNKEHKFTKCAGVLEEHSAFGEDVAFIDPIADENDQVICGFMNDELKLGLRISFSKKQMPWLINWQHWGKNEYVTALEPATNPPIGQAAARENGTLIMLEPGESRVYEIKLDVLNGEAVREFKI